MAQAAVKERPATSTVADQPTSRGEVAVFQPPRLPHHPAVQERFGVDKGQWKVLVEAIFPTAQSVDAVVMALSYCQHRRLDPFKKPVHIVPMWDSKRGGYVETIWPSIAELRTTASRTKQYAGCDEAVFGPMVSETFTGKIKNNGKWEDTEVYVEYPEWCRITVHRIVNGVPCKFVGPKVVWRESYATIGKSDIPNNMWQERPEGQIEKCAEAAALRRAFPEELGNEYSAEEMEGRRIEHVPVDKEVVTTAAGTVAERDDGPPRRAEIDAAAKQDVIEGEFTTVTDGTAHDQDGVVQENEPEKGSHISGDPVDDIDETGSMDDEPAPPKAKGPHLIDSKGMSYAQYADAYIAAINDHATSPGDIFKFADINRRSLDKVYAGHQPTADRIRRASEEKLMELRKAAQDGAPKTKSDPITSGPQPQPKQDDGPPRRSKTKTKAATTVDPEDKLKEIKKLLEAVTDPNDLEDTWLEKCEPIFETLDFPGDKEAAQALHRAAEKRLGIN
jgi:phage recombination protein Bet